jgi:hypothetical protein
MCVSARDRKPIADRAQLRCPFVGNPPGRSVA